MPSANINHAMIDFDDEGSGQPLILLHGFPLDRRIWDAQMDSLKSQMRVITVDLRGFGKSTNSGPFSVSSLADDVAALASYLRLDQIVLGGLSMGGYVAQAFVKKYPRMLNGLILFCTKSEADSEQARQGRNAMADTARTKGASAVADQMFPKMLAPDCAERRPAIAKQLRAIMEACPAETIAHACVALRDRDDFIPLLPKIQCPVLWVAGEHDAIVPLNLVKDWSARIPNCHLEIIKAAGHLAPMEQPAQVSRCIAQFVASLSRNCSDTTKGCCG